MPRPASTVTVPSSSGWRSASSAWRENSPSSSRNSTPRWASVTSPARGGLPPPTRPGAPRSCGAARGTAARQRAGAGGRPHDACDPRHLDRLVARQRRQQRGQPPRGERLACARRADDQQAVPARGGDLERVAQVGLSAQLGEVGMRRAPTPLGLGAGAPRRSKARQLAREVGELPRRAARRRSARRQRRLGGVARPRRRSAPPPCRRGLLGHRENAGDGADRAVERQLAGEPAAAESARRRAGPTRRAAPRRSRGRSPGRPCAGRRARGWR